MKFMSGGSNDRQVVGYASYAASDAQTRDTLNNLKLVLLRNLQPSTH